MSTPDLIIRCVRHHDVDAYLALGWIAHRDCFAGTHHGAYSVLMEWPTEKGDPIEPRDKQEGRAQ